MRELSLFVMLTLAGGAGGLVGSIIGASLGSSALFVGGLIGGLLASPAAAFLAGRLGWVESADVKGIALGAAVGFLAAVTVAVNTLSSPVGPVLSTLLVGAGGLAGQRMTRRSVTRDHDDTKMR
jgi:hypothetical protein